MRRSRILVIDDKLNMLKLFCRMLEEKYDVSTCGDGRTALKLLNENDFDVVVTDVRMPSLDGMEVLRTCKRMRPATEVIMMTAYGEVPQAVEAMHEGAHDYVLKPFEPDEMILVIEKALERKRLVEQTEFLQRQLERKYGFDNIVGNSRAMQDVYALARKAAQSDTTVLLLGESGTGKELFAQAVHYASRRARKRFVAINCAAIPRDLIESELFGHVKGAFSGANANKAGLLEEAEGGTVFFDEISELDLDIQVKINRAIQEREIRAVGDTKDKKIDVRIIAATNRDLEQAVREGKFREDLYYRLNVFPIRIPSLRERREDIPLLAKHFVTKHSPRETPPKLSQEAIAVLCQRSWPGNVRELENTIERAVILEDGDSITVQYLHEPTAQIRVPEIDANVLNMPYRDALQSLTTLVTREYVLGILRRFGGNVTKAAEHAGIERESFHRLMRRCGVRSEAARTPPQRAQ